MSSQAAALPSYILDKIKLTPVSTVDKVIEISLEKAAYRNMT
jgi:hypothetical protein